MRKVLFILLLTAVGILPAAAGSGDSRLEKQVTKTLQSLSLDEKVGQMMQLVIDLFGDSDAQGIFHINSAKADSLFGRYKIGSVLNAPNSCAPTAAQWEVLMRDLQQASLRNIGIPCLFGLDQNHGSTYIQDGTLFPQNINIAASFNRQLAQLAAAATAYETRAISVPWTFGPTVDLGRDPRWPRQWENFGEDCYMNAEMAQAMVRGFQTPSTLNLQPSTISVASCLKHYLGYGVPLSGKDRTPAYISPAELREKHFAPFLAGLQAGAMSVMVNSASVNGLPVHANKELITGWLKEETGWDGVVITDWADVNNLYTREHVAADKKDALRIAVNAGIDMIMEPYSADACTLLKELVNEGLVPMSRINDAVSRILRMKYRLGLFEQPTQRLADYPKLGGPEFATLSLNSAIESMVLLKNEAPANAPQGTPPLLPLIPHPSPLNHQPSTFNSHILLVGPNANQMRCLNGGWSYTWQGHRADEFASRFHTIYEALCEEFGKDQIVLCQGVTYNEKGKYWEENEADIDASVRAAQNADVIIACIGENSYTETPGNLSDLTLSNQQQQLVKALAATGKPLVLVLNEGRPRIIANLEPLATAIVQTFLPGNYGGDALAGLLSGRYNFSGKLPYTYPSEINSLTTYDYKSSETVATMEGAYDYNATTTCQWPFGFGLSYTTFRYDNLRVYKPVFTAADTLTVCVDVTNTGSRVGKETVMLFSTDLVASMTPENRRLRQFEKVELLPGERRTISFRLPARQLSFVGYNGSWVLEPGDFRLTVSNLSTIVRLEASR